MNLDRLLVVDLVCTVLRDLGVTFIMNVLCGDIDERYDATASSIIRLNGDDSRGLVHLRDLCA